MIETKKASSTAFVQTDELGDFYVEIPKELEHILELEGGEYLLVTLEKLPPKHEKELLK